jgi:AICAR transformylase/IMP cyclohydrolase PurH
VVQGNPDFIPPTDEFKEVYGVAVSQKRNDAVITKDLLKEVVTKEKVISEAAGRDLLIATIAVKCVSTHNSPRILCSSNPRRRFLSLCAVLTTGHMHTTVPNMQ